MNEPAAHCCAKLCACRLGVAVGIVWGIGMFVVGIATIYGSYGWKFIEVMGSIYWGVAPGSWRGAWLGLLYGFFDGLIGTAIIAGLYNMMVSCGSCCCGSQRCGTTPPPQP